MNQFDAKFECSNNPWVSFLAMSFRSGNLIKRLGWARALLAATPIFILILAIFWIAFTSADIIESLRLIIILIALGIFLYFLAVVFNFFIYIRTIKISPIFNTKGLKFIKGENGFWAEYIRGENEFIDYSDIKLIQYKYFPATSAFGIPLVSFISGAFYFIDFPRFAVQFRGKDNKEHEAEIPFNINGVDNALDIIVGNVPKEKLKNIVVINEKAMPTIGRKSSLFRINLDTKPGQIILIIFAVIVLSFWIFIYLYFIR